jgi:hypothetical protein
MLLNRSRQYILYPIGMTLLLVAPLAWTQTALTISEKESLDFGVISNENGICKMNNVGALTGTNGQICVGTGVLARFQIKGQANYAFFVLVSGSSSNGVTLTPLIKGGSSKTLSSTGLRNIFIYGNLTLNNATLGVPSLSYLMSVNYN